MSVLKIAQVVILCVVGTVLVVGVVWFILGQNSDKFQSVPEIQAGGNEVKNQKDEPVMKDMENTTTETLPKDPPVTISDPTCTGTKHEYYDLGFGVEHTYIGSVTESLPVQMVLSCDHTKLTLSGSVEQVITASSFGAEELIGAMDYDPINIEADYNFDGHNDLSIVYSQGMGYTALVSTYVFLYSDRLKQFIFIPNVSENLVLDSKNNVLKSVFPFGPDFKRNADLGKQIIYYTWDEMVPRKESIYTCNLNAENKMHTVVYTETVENYGPDGNVMGKSIVKTDLTECSR